MCELNKEHIEEIASILLETSRQNSNNRSNNTAYAAFDAETIFKYGCDRLNGATALYDAGFRNTHEASSEIIEKAIDKAVCKDHGDGTQRLYISISELRDVIKEILC